MACEYSDERLSAYIDGELEAPERERVATHLEACAECRAEVEGLRRIVALGRELAIAPPVARDEWQSRWQEIRMAVPRTAPSPAPPLPAPPAPPAVKRPTGLGERMGWRALAAACLIAALTLLAVVRSVEEPTRDGSARVVRPEPREPVRELPPRDPQPEAPAGIEVVEGGAAPEVPEGDPQPPDGELPEELAVVEESPGVDPIGLGTVILRHLRSYDPKVMPITFIGAEGMPIIMFTSTENTSQER